MKKYILKVTRKNGNQKDVAVYLDDTTAALLDNAGDEKLLRTYLIEEYKDSRKARREAFWQQSLEEDLENGIDYEDTHTREEFSFSDCANKDLQVAIEQLTPRQQEVLRLMYIEGRTQKEIAEIFGIDKRSISDAVKRIYASIQRNYKKN